MVDTINTISAVIVDLDKLSVKGAENMALVLTSIQRLDAVRKELAKAQAEAENVQD